MEIAIVFTGRRSLTDHMRKDFTCAARGRLSFPYYPVVVHGISFSEELFLT
jgi:hypothetical protein